MNSNSFELSPDTLRLIEFLKTIPIGAVATQQQLTTVLGRSIRQHRHLLYSAMKHVQRHDGIFFGNRRGEGYQRCLTEQVPYVGATARRKARRTARSATKTINAVLSKANDVSNETRIAANREISMLGLIEIAAQDRHLPPPESVSSAPLSVAVAARLFLDRFGK
jgi:hypothetical protein